MIKEFIEELETLQRHKIIGKREYHLLTEKYGLSTPDLSRIDYIAKGHLERSHNDALEGKLTSAIAELERGITISPFDLEMQIALGYLFVERYRTKGYLKRDKEKANKLSERCLALEPRSKEAQKLAKEVKGLNNVFQSKQNNKLFMPLLIAIILIILGGTIYSKREFILSRLTQNGKTPLTQESTPLKTQKIIPRKKDVKIISSTIDNKELRIKIHKATFRQTGSGYHFSLQGGVTPVKGAISALSMKLKWPGQTKDEQHTIELVNPEDEPVRPGDTIPLDDYFYFKKLPESIDEAELLIEKISLDSSPSDYPPSIPVKLYKPENLPEGTQLSVKLRNTRFKEGYDALHYGMVYEVENTGYTPVNKLKLNLQWLNDKSQPIAKKEWDFVEINGPPLEPGTKWVKVLKIHTNPKSPITGAETLISVEPKN